MALPSIANAETELDPEGELSRLLFGTQPQDVIDFIETYLTIPNERGFIVPFKLFPQQKKMVFEETGRDITVKGRQTRASSLKIAVRLRRMLFQRYGANALIGAQDDQTTALFRNQILHHIHDLQAAGWDIKLAKDNADELVIAGRQNRFEFVSGSQPTMGRAFARQEAHLSEIAHWPENNIKTLLGGLLPSVPPPPYGYVDLESTPRGEEGSFHEYAMMAQPFDPTDEFTLHFYEWWQEPRYTLSDDPHAVADIIIGTTMLADMVREFSPTEEEKRLKELGHLTVNQLLWRRLKKKSQDKTDAPFIQEYPEDIYKCWVGVTGRYFDSADGEDHLEYYRDNEKPPIKKLESLTYKGSEISFFGPNLHIWEMPIPNDAYVIGFDAAGGGLGKEFDSTSIGVWNANKEKRVARLLVQCTPKQAAHIMCAIGAFYGYALATGERSHHGQVLFDEMRDLAYPNLFYYVDPDKPPAASKTLEPGIYPTAFYRQKLLEEFKRAVIYHEVEMYDPVLNQQMAMFTWQKQQESMKAMAVRKVGSHDDVVMEAAQGWFALKYARMRSKAKFRRQERDEFLIGKNGLVIERRDRATRGHAWLV